MPSSLIDSLNGLVTPSFLSRASSLLGESEGGVAKALGAAFPAVLSGLLARSGDTDAMRRIFDLVTSPANDGSVLRDPGAVLGAQRPPIADLGGQLVSALFGGRTQDIAQAIAQAAGIRSETAASLIGVAAQLVLGLLGERTRRDGLGLQGLIGLLSGERDAIRSALPAGLGSLLGEPARASRAVPPPPERAAAGWLWPALIGLAVLAGLWWLLGRGEPAPAPVATAPPPVAETPPVAAAPPTARLVVRELPGGTRIEVPEGGLETRLVGFIEDAGRGSDEDVWFELDRIQFETGSAALRPESRTQLRDVAAILRAFPEVELEIGGYTDASGDPIANQQLSQARAESVQNQLIAEGVPADRLEAEGYGAAHPIGSNDTEEGRARNRRIALRVTDK